MSRSKPKPKIIKVEPLPKLCEAALDLAKVKADLPKADRRIKAAQAALDSAINHKAQLVACHKELQRSLEHEALLVKPE